MTAFTVPRPRAAEPVSTYHDTGLLHIHFGTGRLGLGLIAPFFQKPGSRLYLLNRAVSGHNPTGSTALGAERRNRLLRENPDKHYVIQKPGGGPGDRQTVYYDGFFEYDASGPEDIIRSIIAGLPQERVGVVVTASVLKAENYGPMIQALNTFAGLMRAGDYPIERLFFVACENTVSAHDIFRDERLGTQLAPETRDCVTRVNALVDRMCVGLEEDDTGSHPVVLVRAEEYGSLKLEMTPETEGIVDLCRGSRIEFSRHVDTEKQIKSWLLNGSHWLIALEAFQGTRGDQGLKLNEFLRSRPEHAQFAGKVMQEMCDGIAVILRSSPQYASFVADVDVDAYLEGAGEAILRRFSTTEDPITRILARFQAPSSTDHDTVMSFSKRFSDRVDEPMRAYEAEHGTVPPAASHGLQSFIRLLASGTFIDT